MVAKRALAVLLLIMLLAPLVPAPGVRAQGVTPSEEVLRLFESLTPEERVGQLFLVTFTGTDTGPESQIYNLITNYHIGGVALLAENDNFTPAPDTLTNVHDLIANLQRIEWENSNPSAPDSTTGTPPERAYVPLLVGIEQEGGGTPYDQILNGLTAIPNAMSLGAAWRPELTQQVGQVQGRELSALGINLYLGPSLDVLDLPNPAARSSLETRSFGGDPYWVGEMGRAFITGLHTGSNGRMLVVAKHFPGLGSSDRPVDEEVATVRKSLEQLKQIELAPFFAVTGKAPNSLSMADGLLVSHIRFQGFQGNIRAATRPVSFDPTALGEILDLPELSTWRDNGGLIVSDDLGNRAVRFFYAPTNEGFSADIVARDAFLAGNDLLYLGNIVSSDLDDTYATNIRILNFFSQRYREDPAFAQQVDEAVLRILTRKVQLFVRFQLSDVLVPVSALDSVGQSQQLVYEVARRSATIISPDVQELTSLLPSPPLLRDRLVFITDTGLYKQCSTCPVNSSLSLYAMQEAVVRLYGPTAAGQVSEARLNSYTFDDLTVMLNTTDLDTMVSDINRSTMVVLLLSDSNLGQPELISRFLSERQDLLRDKRIILFSFTAPYFFDATDISKLSAYYSLYSKQPAFLDVAARLLYQEMTPLGYSPVSIPGTGYDLIEVTSPNPDQIIPLSLDMPPGSVPDSQPTPFAVFATQTPVPTVPPEPTAIPLLGIGDTIYIRTGVIYDHNNHPVPDGTVVRFTMLLSGQGGGIIQQSDQTTVRGMAQASFALEKPGLVEIRASSDPAVNSLVVQLDVSSGQAAAVTVIAPFPTETVEPTPIPPTPVVEDEFVTLEGYPRFSSWMLAVLFIGLSAWLAYWAGNHLQSQRWGWRWGICVLLGGLAGYNATTLGLLGSTQIVLASGLGGVLGMSALGELIGLGLGWVWSRQAQYRNQL
jgi:beta-N-acetylhexosaminidase